MGFRRGISVKQTSNLISHLNLRLRYLIYQPESQLP
ncbi:unnamed protein product [Arabidopsis halleri]